MWDRLLTVLGMMYATCEQTAGADESSDYRLVVSRWIEKKPFGAQKRGRCALCDRPAQTCATLTARCASIITLII